MISLIFSLIFHAPCLEERVAIEAAYVVVTYMPPAPKCCGNCNHGKIVHGDKHVTDCPCPPTCACKTKSLLKEAP
jgi:hypothetical protein